MNAITLDRARVAAGWRWKQANKAIRAGRIQAEARGRWYFRHAEHRGERCWVFGSPLVTAEHISIGDDFLLWSIHRKTHLGGDPTGRLEFGDRVFINSGAILLSYERITLADDVGIASEVFITDSDNHPIADRPMKQAPVTIGRGAWIATRATILAGVNIGSRAVVGAGSLVVGDVPDDTLVAGVPARPIRQLSYPPGATTAWRGDAQP
jgi:acetyltransferase-like isoleucine patch superfamily enzyme